LSGRGAGALALSAKVADTHIFDAASVEEIRQQVNDLASLAKQHGRSLGFGLRIDVVARETEQEAIHDAHRFREQSGQKAHGSAPLVQQNLWAGLSTDVTGANATLVGSYEQVTQALVEYSAAGITSFLLSSVPHFEEAYRLGEYVLPAVRSQIRHDQRRAA